MRTFCVAVASVNVYPALVMWTIMFAVFAFPAEFAGIVQRRFGPDPS